MEDLSRFALVTLTAILFIVDPIAVVPTYLVITRDEGFVALDMLHGERRTQEGRDDVLEGQPRKTWP